ncbi:hypothetical protein HF883_10315 [Cloacibacillus porcorum]|uniref:hypothetical protein n=1 Tax=Cloacibacillus porcorum TaxID=1197717 RepID=UPI001459F1D6|nr:hypothetical protein [Cloacibacillus porcorum]NMF18613.1 hypothetical protein [Cloacibacillus porcorum]
MHIKALSKVSAIMDELQSRIETLLDCTDYYTGESLADGLDSSHFPKESGAVRRASMDLTRALAELRKS